MSLQNWAGNLTYSTGIIDAPSSVEELQELVRASNRIKPLGTRHSFNDIADTDGALLSLENLTAIESLDRDSMTVTVQAGASYGTLSQYLCAEGFALHNLASLPHISVGGACATATHGSGDANGCLTTAVRSMEIVKANGELVKLSRGDADFAGAAVHLGALGIVTKLTLDVLPLFTIRQQVYENLTLDALAEDFDALTSSAYSVSLFTDWKDARFNQVWVKRAHNDAQFEGSDIFFGCRQAPGPMHPIPGIAGDICTIQLAEEGPWHERLPHFRLEFTPSAGEELQSEYLVPRPFALQALERIAAMRETIAPILQISEIRTIARDGFWMSPFSDSPCFGIHFTWKKDWPAVQSILPKIESALEHFQARPHWGKLFTMEPDRLRFLYPRLPEFKALARHFDPEGKFQNSFLNRYLFP